QFREAARLVQLRERRDRPLAEQDAAVAGLQHRRADAPGLCARGGGQILGPERVAVAGGPGGEPEPAPPGECLAQRVRRDAELSLGLDEADTAALRDERERRWRPAMVKEPGEWD